MGRSRVNSTRKGTVQVWAGAPEHVQVRLSVVRTGTATVRTGMLGRYLATSLAVEPPRVSTTMSAACTCDVEGSWRCWGSRTVLALVSH